MLHPVLLTSLQTALSLRKGVPLVCACHIPVVTILKLYIEMD